MASLLFLSNQFGDNERETMAATLLEMLNHHYDEGTLQRPKPEEKPAPAPRSPPAEPVVSKAPPQDVAPLNAAATTEAATSAAAPSASSRGRPQSATRRVGGQVPASPYAPRSQSRPSSATTRPASGKPMRPNSAPHSPNRGQQSARSGGGAFVERWMEKLYLRQPVVVPTDSQLAAMTATSRQASSGEQQNASAPEYPPRPQSVNENPFKLPPRPASVSRHAQNLRRQVQRQQSDEMKQRGGVYAQLLNPSVQASVHHLNFQLRSRSTTPGAY